MISLPFSGSKKEINIKIIIYYYVTQHSVSDSLSLKADVQIHLFIKTTYSSTFFKHSFVTFRSHTHVVPLKMASKCSVTECKPPNVCGDTQTS